MRDRKAEDYSHARRGTHNPAADDDVHKKMQDDCNRLRRGEQTESAKDRGVREQGKTGKGY